MSDKPESSKTQLEVLEANLLEKLSAKSMPSTFVRVDLLSQLPAETAFRIIGYLAPGDLMACAGVSRTWRRLCEDNRTWQRICLENGYMRLDAPSVHFFGGWAENRENVEAILPHMDLQEADHSRPERESPFGQCYERSAWKSLYLRKQQIISNWRSRAIQSSTVIECGDWITCLRIQSGRIVAGFHHGSLRVWNVDDAQLVFTLAGHTAAVATCQISDDGKCVISCSLDETVRVWCGQTGVQLHVLRGHTGWVQCMSLHGTTLVSGSGDQTIRVWDIVDGKCLHILTGHLEVVSCVQFDGERVVSGSEDSILKVWNVHTGECLYTLTGHRLGVYRLLFEPERELVVSGSKDRTIRIWDLRRGTCIAHLGEPQNSAVSGIELRGNILLSCAYYAVFVWDIRDGGSCIHRLEDTDTSCILSMQWLDSGLLVTASYGGRVKLWDVDKGIYVCDLLCLEADSSIEALKATDTLLVFAVELKGRTEHKLILINFDASYP